MYTGYELTASSRSRLSKVFPPKHPTWLGHHITEQFGVPSDHAPPPQPNTVKVIGYTEADGIEGLLVSIDGKTERPDGRTYHLTWSIDKTKGVVPADTNKILHDYKSVEPIIIETISKTFTKSTEDSLKETHTLKDNLKERGLL